jgi:FdhE protein
MLADVSREVRKALEDRVKTLVELRPSHRQVLEFYGAVLKAQLDAKESFQVDVLPVQKNGVLENKTDSAPLLKREIPVDFGDARKLFRSLCRIAKKQNQTLEEGVEKIGKAVRSRKIDLDRILGEMMLSETPYTNRISSSLELNRDILVFLARASIQPLLEKVAGKLAAQFDDRQWNRATCPICGSPPIVSELSGEQGKRMWICSLCGHRWSAHRMACPFCGQKDPEAHRYLFVKGDDTVRIDLCEGCKRYIKTIDSRKMAVGIFPLLENMATLHLDVLAQQEGYERGSAPFLDIK